MLRIKTLPPLSQLLALFAMTLLLGSCAASNQTQQDSGQQEDTVITLINQMPAENQTEQRWLNEELLKTGPDGLQALAGLLSGSGDDATVRYGVNGLAKHLSSTGGQERAMFEEILLDELRANRSTPVKIFLMEQLELVGSSEAVPVLEAFVGDPSLNEPAVHALRAIDTGAAEQVLIDGLAEVDESQRPVLIKALGDMQVPAAAEALAPYADSDDDATRSAALYTLAQTGNPEAGPAVNDSDSPFNRLTYAGRLADEGHTGQSINVCRELLDSDHPANVRAGALKILVDVEGEDALEELTEAVADRDPVLRAAALRLARALPGEELTGHWLEQVRQQNDAEVRAGLIDMLGRRGDETAFEELLPYLDDSERPVQVATAGAVVSLGGEQALPNLIETLTVSDDSEVSDTLKAALLRLPTESLSGGVADALPQARQQALPDLIEILAERRADSYTGEVLAVHDGADEPVRLAVYRSMEHLGSPDELPRLLEWLTESENDKQRAALQTSIVAISRDIPEADQRAESVLNALAEASDDYKPYLLETLSEIGGEQALQATGEAAESTDGEVRKAAIKALAGWPDPSAAPLLLDAIEEAPESDRKDALEGYIALVVESKYSAEDKVQFLSDGLDAAASPSEQVLLLEAFADVRTPASLRAVAGRFDSNDEEVSKQALRTAAEILEPEYDGSGSFDGARSVLAVLEATTTPEIRTEIEEYITELKKEKDSNDDSGAYAADYSGGNDQEEGPNVPPENFRPLFNGQNLDGWKGLVENPEVRAEMSEQELAEAQAEADSLMQEHWSVRDGILYFDGEGSHLVTEKDYKDFEMLLDWKIEPGGDSGVYLRGTPQVQIWDITEWPQGSGGLYNNQEHLSEPLVPADNSIGEWNTMRIKMVGERVTVDLNGQTVVPNVVLENYWNREEPIYSKGAIELQSHSTPLYFRNIFIREIPRTEALFNGEDLSGWEPVGDGAATWEVDDEGRLYTEGEGGGWLSTEQEYDNYRLELEYRLPEGGNSGVFLRAPREGNPAYEGMEIQLLDDGAEEYAELQPWQYTGSIYGVQAPSRRATKEPGEWQRMVIEADGPEIQVTLNGERIINTSLTDHMDKVEGHPGLKRRSGHIGLQNHSTRVEFRNVNITEIE